MEEAAALVVILEQGAQEEILLVAVEIADHPAPAAQRVVGVGITVVVA